MENVTGGRRKKNSWERKKEISKYQSVKDNELEETVGGHRHHDHYYRAGY